MPTTAGRLRVRGYNQAELLAVALARRWDQPVDVAGLERSGDHASQVLLGPLARRANVQDAFHASAPPGPGAPAVLVDDVLTTGATVVAAAQALLAAGWDVVAAVTFARARTYQGRVMDGGA